MRKRSNQNTKKKEEFNSPEVILEGCKIIGINDIQNNKQNFFKLYDKPKENQNKEKNLEK